MSALKEDVLENDIIDTENTNVLEQTLDDQKLNDYKDDPYLELALEYGFKPDGKKPPKEFVKYALDNLPKKTAALDSQNKAIENKDRKLAELEVVLNQLSSDMDKQKQLAYNQAMADLKAQHRDAIRNGNDDLVDRIETAQENLKKHQEKEVVSHEELKQQAYNELLINNFRKNNDKWINGDSVEELDMQVYARQIEATLASKGIDLEQILDKMDTAIKAKYSSYFKEGHQSVAGGELSNSTGSTSKKKYTANDLNEGQRMAGKYYVDRKIMTMETYIKRLIEQGDLK